MLARLGTLDGLSTCVFGSWAREELTAGSDDDWAALVARPFAPYDADVLREVVAAQAVLGEGERRPGAQAVFGEPVCVPDLWARIGLDADTNTNFTRRMLLLLESRELHGDVRRSAIEQILGRYLYESHAPGQPPRSCSTTWSATGARSASTSRARPPGDPTRSGRPATPSCARRAVVVRGRLVPVLLCHLCEPSETAAS